MSRVVNDVHEICYCGHEIPFILGTTVIRRTIVIIGMEKHNRAQLKEDFE
jgi:hypothetical protein